MQCAKYSRGASQRNEKRREICQARKIYTLHYTKHVKGLFSRRHLGVLKKYSCELRRCCGGGALPPRRPFARFACLAASFACPKCIFLLRRVYNLENVKNTVILSSLFLSARYFFLLSFSLLVYFFLLFLLCCVSCGHFLKVVFSARGVYSFPALRAGVRHPLSYNSFIWWLIFINW